MTSPGRDLGSAQKPLSSVTLAPLMQAPCKPSAELVSRAVPAGKPIGLLIEACTQVNAIVVVVLHLVVE